jgi:ribose/xylose/arabinose/galactoside ABC-type transport system permease subunit
MSKLLTPAITAPPRSRPKFSKLALRAVIGLVALLVVTGALTTDGFLSSANATAIITSVSVVGILAIGMTAIMIGGSFASMSLGTTAAVMAMLFVHQLSLGLAGALVVSILAGAAACAFQGWIVGSWNANPIILTIAAGSIQVGAATFLTDGRALTPGNDSYQLLNLTPLGIPISVFVFLALVLIVEFVFRRTTFGRMLFMTGENRRAARAAGLPVTRLTAGAFALAGACAGLAGALLGAYNQGASMQLEGTLTFDAVAATLIGGTVVTGGRGSAWQT